MDEDAEETIRRLERELTEARKRRRKRSFRLDRRWAGAAVLGVALIGIAAIFGWLEEPQTVLDRPGGYDSETQRKIAEDIAARRESGLPPPPPAGAWTYASTRDAMTGGWTHTACVLSANRTTMTFPYSDGPARLCIRQSAQHGLDAYVSLTGGGQILCHRYDNCTIPIRFDSGDVQRFSGTDAADGSSDIAFIVNASRLVGRLRQTGVTRVQLTLYQAGTQTLEFHTADLEWPRPAPAG